MLWFDFSEPQIWRVRLVHYTMPAACVVGCPVPHDKPAKFQVCKAVSRMPPWPFGRASAVVPGRSEHMTAPAVQPTPASSGCAAKSARSTRLWRSARLRAQAQRLKAVATPKKKPPPKKTVRDDLYFASVQRATLQFAT